MKLSKTVQACGGDIRHNEIVLGYMDNRGRFSLTVPASNEENSRGCQGACQPAGDCLTSSMS
jgi:hypothetical protein